MSPTAEGQGGVEQGWQSLVLSMDCISFLRFHLATSHKPEVIERLLQGKRTSTLYQNNVSWKAFHDFVKASNPIKPDTSLLLEFCIWLRDNRNLATNTILNYKAAVGQVLEKVLCEVINEADPGSFPQAHDIRRVVTSLAWTRGLEPAEITKRTFWK